MKPRHYPIIAAIVAFTTFFVIILARIFPHYSAYILASFLTVNTLAIVIVLMYNFIYLKCRTSIETGDITDIIEDLNTEIVLWTNDFSAVFLNRKLRALLGITSSDFDNQEILKKIFGLETLDEHNIKRLIDGKCDESYFQDADNYEQCIIWSTSLLKQNKKCSLYFSTGFNLTEINIMQKQLSESHEKHNLSMELSEIGILISQGKDNFFASSEMIRMLGLNSNLISFSYFRSLIHPNDRTTYDSYMKKISYSTGVNSEVNSLELRVKSHDGSYRWYSYRFKAVKNATSDTPIIGGAFLDITQEREKDILIEKLAYVDEITEIANRNKLVKIGQETYECCVTLDYSYWVIVLDIDRFHIINDSCGYEAGNKLLRNFAHNLYKYISLGGLAARISGDNFAVIIRDYGDDELPRKTVEAIQRDFADFAVNEFSSHSLTCSAGYSKLPDNGDSFIDVLEHAEFALKSSNEKRSSITAYSNSMHDAIIGDNELEKALSDAIDNHELRLFYQPKIEIATGKIIGVEALVRWIKPDGTIVQPCSFVPIAESSHLIGKISEFVLNEACRQNMMWQRMGYPEIIMSINFTSYDFYKKDLRETVFDTLIRSGLDAKWLEIELTESLALHDVDFALFQMNQLRELGVRLAMDDFGTGYSSLSYVQILPITLLKLDRSFVVNIETDNIAYEIVAAVIKIAKLKKIEVIAEGIENPRQATILRNAGCDFAQGFLYGKPMPPEQIQEYFEKNQTERQVF
ncbi:MAG: EAL domain-containing protein [Ruminococcus sp.]|nr:EAL domain-containing protein [Ruminococcus sp.]MBO5384087.1 EAL domain-containing protein [Ruminococcus sp.]MBR6671142.1 EAL domain-containing protein [Ruminococcus sp.]